MQAIYQSQLNAQPWQDLHQQFLANEDMPRADSEYFRELVQQVCGSRELLDADLAALVDRPPKDLDPVEHAILLIGLYELKARNDIPFKVVINEGVGLATTFRRDRRAQVRERGSRPRRRATARRRARFASTEKRQDLRRCRWANSS